MHLYNIDIRRGTDGDFCLKISCIWAIKCERTHVTRAQNTRYHLLAVEIDRDVVGKIEIFLLLLDAGWYVYVPMGQSRTRFEGNLIDWIARSRRSAVLRGAFVTYAVCCRQTVQQDWVILLFARAFFIFSVKWVYCTIQSYAPINKLPH